MAKRAKVSTLLAELRGFAEMALRKPSPRPRWLMPNPVRVVSISPVRRLTVKVDQLDGIAREIKITRELRPPSVD